MDFSSDSECLSMRAARLDRKFISYDVLAAAKQPPFGFDEREFYPNKKPLYFKLRYEEKPADFLIPHEDLVKVELIYPSPDFRSISRVFSGAFHYLGSSEDGNYLLLSYPKFFAWGQALRLLRPTTCGLYRYRWFPCACIVLRNRHLATTDAPQAYRVLKDDCRYCHNEPTTRSEEQSAEGSDRGDARVQEVYKEKIA